jgi:hypothetical protein
MMMGGDILGKCDAVCILTAREMDRCRRRRGAV